PDTFDAHGYVNLLRRLRDQTEDVVYAPEFRREIEEPIAGAVPVFPDTPLIVTEGNYLLVPEHPWGHVRDLLDEVWFLRPDEPERHRRLIARHELYGRSRDEARNRALGSDERNATVINATAARADLVLPG
ncbi:nucleoside/nucleotide kinase family protein, partial [Kibdelosporangium lantanae]